MDYPLHLRNRHLFIDLPEGRTLVDTGAPSSASIDGHLTWRQQVVPTNRGGYHGLTFPGLSRELGLEVYGLLGMDQMSRAALHFSLHETRLQVTSEPPAGSLPLPYEVARGTKLPVLRARLHGHPARVAWDTGAQYGYVVDPRFTAGLPSQPGFHDFSPLFGDLDPAESFEMPVEIAGHRFTERVALAPARLAEALRAFGLQAIIGPGVLRSADFWLDPTTRRYALRPLTS